MTKLISKGFVFPSSSDTAEINISSFRNRSVNLSLKISSSCLPRSDFCGRRLVINEGVLKFNRRNPQVAALTTQMTIGFRKPQKWWDKGIQPNMKEVTSAQDLVESLLSAGDKLVVVDFFSPGCGGCKALHPKLCQLAEMNPDVQFLQVNYEEHKSMCYSLNVHVLPFFRFYRGAEGRVCSFSCTNATVPNPSVSSSHPVSHSISSRLHIFKPTGERNGVSSVVNSSLSPNTHSKGPNTLLVVPVASSTRSPANIAASSTVEAKPVGTMVQKKPSSQAQSRNDFFNLMRKKSIGSSSAVNVEGCAVSPSSSYDSGVSEVLTAHGISQDQDASLSDEILGQSTEILGENTCNSDSSDEKNTDKSFSRSDAIFCSDEEEAALLRSMGWEENADEGGLTEEEISAFWPYKCHGLLP